MKRQGLVVFAGDSLGDLVLVLMDLLPMGLVFFPSFPYMGAMLFPSFVLGNAFGEGGTLFVQFFLFSLIPLSLLSSPSSFSHSLFLLFLFFPISFPFPFAHSLPSFPSLSSPSPSFSVSLPLFPSSFSSSIFLFLSLSWGFCFFLGNCLYCLFPRCKE